MLESIIPTAVAEQLGYTEELKLKDAAMIVIELADGNFVVSVQLSPNPLLANRCVMDFISEQDFNQALQYYSQFGITEFLTKDEFLNLSYVSDIEI